MERNNVRIGQRGDEVILEINGRAITMPWDMARDLGDALKVKANEAQAVVEHDRVVIEQAILQAAGFPVGITDDPYIHREAANEALYGKIIRGSALGGVESAVAVGIPRIYNRRQKHRVTQELKDAR